MNREAEHQSSKKETYLFKAEDFMSWMKWYLLLDREDTEQFLLSEMTRRQKEKSNIKTM